MSKTIVDKLNLRKYKQAAVLFHPAGEFRLAGLEAGYDTELREGVEYDLIFAFTLDMKALRQLVSRVIDSGALQEDGYLFAAYPKKGNKAYPTYIHRDELLDGLGADGEGYIGTSRLKFARMVGLDDVFTVVGFKMEKLKSKSASGSAPASGHASVSASASNKPSQLVDDYIERIPEIENDLLAVPDVLAFYRSLTPGYRKDWARYVYSAIREGTRAKRREEMIAVLGAGYKSMDLYRRR